MTNGSPDEAFLKAFEDCTLPFAEWRHRAHLKVAYLYLYELPFDEALAKARKNIKRYNAATNTPEALERGYHETITVSWMRLVDFTLCERGPAASADQFVEREAQFLNKEALLKFYSREQLISWRAKSEFVEPDLAPFPIRSKPTNGEGTADTNLSLIRDSRSSSLRRE
jgi:hypothetical protein